MIGIPGYASSSGRPESARRGGSRPLAYAWICAAVLPTALLAQGLPDVSQTDFPNDDAVILRQVQHWTLGSDGGVVHEEHRWVKLFNDRAWRRYADPCVDYLEGAEDVELIAARGHTPDGQTLDSPDYAINVVTPAGVSKWPAMSAWRRVCYTFSGVQNDAVLELHYKRTSKPGVRRWLEGDLRIGDLDPVIERVVAVTLPKGTELKHRLDRTDARQVKLEKTDSGSQTIYRWTISQVASDADEPGCPPWQQRCGRLRFTNCPSAQLWAEDILEAVERSAGTGERITKFVTEAAEDEVDESDRVRAIAKKLRDTFNFVGDRRGWVGRQGRPAEEVFDSCYGSTLEAAGLTLAVMRATGLDARPMIAVERDQYNPEASTDTDLTAVVIEVACPGGAILLDPASGIINRNGVWGDRDVLGMDGGKLQRLSLASESTLPDAVRVRGRLALDDKAENLTGEMTIELSGLFVNTEELRTDEQKKSRLQSIVKGIMPILEVSEFSVSRLSAGQLSAHVSVKSKEEPDKVYNRRMLTLAPDTPALAEAHLHLGPSKRRTPIQLPGLLTDDVSLHIKLPDGFKAVILPRPLEVVSGQWGRIAQTVEPQDGAVQITRRVSFDVRTIEPADYALLRDAVRALRSDGARSIVLEEVTE